MNLPDSPTITRVHPRVRMHKWARYLVNIGQQVMVRPRLRSTTRRSALLTSNSPKHADTLAAATAVWADMSEASSVRSAKPMTKRTAKLRKRYALTKVCRLPLTLPRFWQSIAASSTDYSGELRTFVADETAMLGNEFKLAPPGQDGGRGTGDGEGRGDEGGGRSTQDGSGGPGRRQRRPTLGFGPRH